MSDKPPVICLCGSTRFKREFEVVRKALTIGGNIVLGPEVFAHDGDEISAEQKLDLDQLHMHKIDMADHIVVICPGDYIGDSTQAEIDYAEGCEKEFTYLNEIDVPLERDISIESYRTYEYVDGNITIVDPVMEIIEPDGHLIVDDQDEYTKIPFGWKAMKWKERTCLEDPQD